MDSNRSAGSVVKSFPLISLKNGTNRDGGRGDIRSKGTKEKR